MPGSRVDDMPTSYQEALARLKGRDERTIAFNTRLRFNPDSTISLVLHSTAVVTWHASGHVTLNSGGWRSVTTKARMNRALFGTPYRVFSERYAWKISTPEGTFDFEDGDTWPL